MPLLRFIRLADSDKEVVTSVYSRIEAVQFHFKGNQNRLVHLPDVAKSILALYHQESKSWLSDMNIEMHTLNPVTSNDFRIPEVNLVAQFCFDKIF